MANSRVLEVARRFREDFPYFAERCLVIQPKEGGAVPFCLNFPQQYTHGLLEQQRKTWGRVRAIILKARKEGISTYIGGRYYHRVTHTPGMRARVITHHRESTAELFEMIRRYHRNSPEVIRPRTERSSVRELYFNKLDSYYLVATAGHSEGGRGGTPHLLHASEYAFWRAAEKSQAGIMESVPDTSGTEIVIESTADGMGNPFHKKWLDAAAGQSEYLPIFIPWFYDPQYRRDTPDFEPTEEEQKLADLYELDEQQLAWRRNKVTNLGPRLFKQEFPATPIEAFQVSTANALIDSELVLAARQRVIQDTSGDVVAGIDPAGDGDDRSALVIRQGYKLHKLITSDIKNTMHVLGAFLPVMEACGVKYVGIDNVGLGKPIGDRLEELGWTVLRINAGDRALDARRYYKVRSEMWDLMRIWLEYADIPDTEELHQDLTGPERELNSSQQLVLESKKSMKKRGLRSPDLGDALAISIEASMLKQGAEVEVGIY